MSLFPIRKRVINKIFQIKWQFLWCNSYGKISIPLVSWELLELLKILNIENLHRKSLALLFRWIWRFLTKPPALWNQVIRLKYGYANAFSLPDLSIPRHGGPWRALCSSILHHSLAKALTFSNVSKKVVNGANILFQLSPSSNAPISLFDFWDGLQWKWCFSWKRDLRPQDVLEEKTLFNNS